MAVANIFAFSDPAINLIMDICSQYGWDNCPFTDDNLASKRLARGYSPRGQITKTWQLRLVISDDSIFLLLRFLSAAWARRPPVLRRSMERSVLEEHAQVAAFITNTKKEMLDAVPLHDETVVGAYIGAWLAGDSNLEVELQSHITERNERFSWRDVTVLKALEQCHVASSTSTLNHSTFRN